jgi:hypothetical protein
MDNSPEAYISLLREAFPQDFLKAMLQGVFLAHKVAPDHVKRHFERYERTNLTGHIRRSKLNEELMALGAGFVNLIWPTLIFSFGPP